MRAKILNASAGSGKTYRLAYKYVYDVLSSHNSRGEFDVSAYRHILAVTFTNKATEEMKSRILKQINALASGAASDYLAMLLRDTGLDEAELRRRAMRVRTAILHDYSRFTVLTNDKFFQRILRAFIKELGIELNYSLELETAPIIAESADALLEEIGERKELRNWITDMVEDRIERGQKWNIRHGILSLNKELFKEQTEAAIKAIGNKEQLKKAVFKFNGEVQKEVDALRAEAQKAVDIITQAGYKAEDFKNSTASYLFRTAAGNITAPTATAFRMIGASPQDWFTKKSKPDAGLLSVASRIQPIMDHVCARAMDVVSADISRNILRKNYLGFALLNDLYRKVLDICKENNTMLLSETKRIIAQFINDNDAPFIYEKVGNRFDRYMIDEFQDTSLGEWHNFLPLLRNAMAQSEEVSVLLVGDIKQSIYRWRGSDWKILGSVAPAELGRENIDIETLDCNYRSLPTVVEFNNMVFERGVERDNATLNTALEIALCDRKISPATYKTLYDTLRRAYSGHAQTPRRRCTHSGYVNITIHGKEDEPGIVARIKSIIDQGYRPCDITILVREKKESYSIAQQLLAVKSENDPRYRFDVMTQEALRLNSAPVIKFLLAVMRLAINRRDSVSLAIYNRYHKACDFTAQPTAEESALWDSLAMLSPEEAFENIVMHYHAECEGQTAYVMALHEEIVRFCAKRVADIALFLKWWDENGGNKSLSVERGESTIEIMTIHKAKGLENKVVLIPYCDWRLTPSSNNGMRTNIIWAAPIKGSNIDGIGTFPVPFMDNVAQSAFAEGYYTETVYAHTEAINMLYVAFTRAGEQLHIFISEDNLKDSKGNPKDGKNVGGLLYSLLPENEFTACDDGTRQYTLGKFDAPEPFEKRASDTERVRMDDCTTSPVNLRLRLQSARYFDNGEQVQLSPRNMGIRLHRVFENASSREDIAAAIAQMVTDGILSADDARSLTAQVEQTLNTTIAGEWFSGQWTTVRRESNILAPRKGLLRPDRVMIRGGQAVVVDYKFGKPQSQYGEQVKEYASMLTQMGYDDVRGYLWYIKSGNIEQIV